MLAPVEVVCDLHVDQGAFSHLGWNIPSALGPTLCIDFVC